MNAPREKHAYLAAVNALAVQVRALAAEYDKNPHAVVDAVRGAVTLPYDDTTPTPRADSPPRTIYDLPIAAWAMEEL